MKIVKMRVGKVLDLTTNELLYNVESSPIELKP